MLNKKKKITQIIITALVDIALVILIIASFASFYYPDIKSRLIWKLGITLNMVVLLFEFRVRVTFCVGYPLEDLKALGCCCVITRIRMKLADYLCFYYIFFVQLIDCCLLFVNKPKSPIEATMFKVIVGLNALYLFLWIVLTRNSSFKRFPKETQRTTSESQVQTQALIEQIPEGVSQNAPGRNHNAVRRKLNTVEASTLVKSMPAVLVPTQHEKLLINEG